MKTGELCQVCGRELRYRCEGCGAADTILVICDNCDNCDNCATRHEVINLEMITPEELLYSIQDTILSFSDNHMSEFSMLLSNYVQTTLTQRELKYGAKIIAPKEHTELARVRPCNDCKLRRKCEFKNNLARIDWPNTHPWDLAKVLQVPGISLAKATGDGYIVLDCYYYQTMDNQY